MARSTPAAPSFGDLRLAKTRVSVAAFLLCLARSGCGSPYGIASAPDPDTNVGGASDTAKEVFAIVVLPDTQYAVQNWPEVFYAQTQWIADNAAARNIRYVIHVGDIQEMPRATRPDFPRTVTGMSKLDGHVPYVIAIGNHDLDAWVNGWDGIATDRSADLWNSYYPRSKFAGWPTFGGTYPSTINDNSFHRFRAGGTDWLILTLKFDPTDDELAWGQEIVAANPNRQVIINTHDFMNGVTRSAAGDRIWAALKTYANVSFILNGHFVNAGHRDDAGDAGNIVHQIMADYQSSTSRDPNSYLRVMELDPNEGTVAVETYSPYLGLHMSDSANRFLLTSIDYMPSTTPAPGLTPHPYEAETTTYHRIGRADGDGWSASTASDAAGHLFYGPYANDWGDGLTQAIFTLMVDNNSADDLVVATLDAYDSTSKEVLASRPLRRREFRGAGAYQGFSLTFSLAGRSGHAIETRVYWHDVSYMKLDKVVVRTSTPSLSVDSDTSLSAPPTLQEQ
jgi:hypothetical protein